MVSALYATAEPAPDPTDIHVGAQLRMQRQLRQWTQQTLATRLGVSFQQLQKYENGSNRISASMLMRAARALDVPVADFFAGLEQPDGSTIDRDLLPRAVRLANQLRRLPLNLRQQLHRLIDELAANPAETAR